MSQRELADHIGYHATYISRLETDRQPAPGRRIINAIADALHLSHRERQILGATSYPTGDAGAASRTEVQYEELRRDLAEVKETLSRILESSLIGSFHPSARIWG